MSFIYKPLNLTKTTSSTGIAGYVYEELVFLKKKAKTENMLRFT